MFLENDYSPEYDCLNCGTRIPVLNKKTLDILDRAITEKGINKGSFAKYV